MEDPKEIFSCPCADPWREAKGRIESKMSQNCSKIDSLTKRHVTFEKDYLQIATFKWLFGIMITVLMLLFAGGYAMNDSITSKMITNKEIMTKYLTGTRLEIVEMRGEMTNYSTLFNQYIERTLERDNEQEILIKELEKATRGN